MTGRQKLFSAALLMLGSMTALPVFAQNAAAPDEWAIEFVGRMLRNADQAFVDFKAETYVGQTVAPSSETMREAYRKNVAAYGPVQTYEVAIDQSIGERLRRVIILTYHPKGVQALTMDFYKQTPSNGWYLHGMKIDNSVQAMPWMAAMQSRATPAETKPR